MKTNTSMTIYNKIAGTETYQRTVIIAAAWENRKAVNGLKTGVLASNTARVFIPKSVCGDYIAPKAWQALVSKSGKWTLQEGDVIVKGAVTDEIRAAIPYSAGPPVVEAVAAVTMTNIKAKYDDVLTVTSIDTHDNGHVSMHHFEVGAK
jgi:hypothetical protein